MPSKKQKRPTWLVGGIYAYLDDRSESETLEVIGHYTVRRTQGIPTVRKPFATPGDQPHHVMPTPVFVEADYADPPCTGLQTREADGTWLGATAYTHAVRGNVVLWYGGDTYEGNLASSTEWRAWSKEGLRPPNVPANPDRIYKGGGWQGWGAWLGTGNTRNTTPFLPFVEALAVSRSLGLANSTEWKVWSKEGMRPANVPSEPHVVYTD